MVNIYINKLKWKGGKCSKRHLLYKCCLCFLLKYYYSIITARLYNCLQYFVRRLKFLWFWISFFCFCYCSICCGQCTNVVFRLVQYLLLISGAAAAFWLCGTLGLIVCLLTHIIKVRTLNWFSRQACKILQRTTSNGSWCKFLKKCLLKCNIFSCVYFVHVMQDFVVTF